MTPARILKRIKISTSNQLIMNFADFIASLTPEQAEAFKSFLHDNVAEANIFQNRAHNSHVEAYWNGRFDSFQLLYCHIEPKCFGSEEHAQQFIEMASQTPDRWRLGMDENNDEEKCDSDSDSDSEDDENEGDGDGDIVQVSYAQLGNVEYRCFIKKKNNSQSYVLFLDEEDNVGGGHWIDNTSIRTTSETTTIPWGYV